MENKIVTEKDKRREIKIVMIKKHVNHALGESWTFIEYVKGVSIFIIALGFSFMLFTTGMKILFM